MTPHVFATCTNYALGSLIGGEKACALITEIVKSGDVDVPPWLRPIMAGAMTLHRCHRLFETTLRVTGGSTRIAASRSRDLHAALESKCDVWLTVDADVELSEQTLEWLVEAAVDEASPRVVFAPCLMRPAEHRAVNIVAGVAWHELYLTRRLVSGGKVRRALRNGFGCVALNRAAIELVSERAPKYRDDDGVSRAAPFVERFTPGGQWLGEDVSFFAQLPPEIVVEGLVTGGTRHCGLELDLKELDP